VPPGQASAEEAARRLDRFGPNASVGFERPAWRVLLGKFIAPVPCLLEAAIVLQLLGEYIEAAVISVLLVFSAATPRWRRLRLRPTQRQPNWRPRAFACSALP